jgi:hypothetical protein
MLSSSPSLLLSALSPLPVAGEALVPAVGEAASGFAELLNGVAAKIAEAISGEESKAQGEATQAVACDTLAQIEGTALTGRADVPTAGKDGPASAAVATETMAATLAAIESGKFLPVALPEAAAPGDEADAKIEAEATDPLTEAGAAPPQLPAAGLPLPPMAGVVPPQTARPGEAEPTRTAALPMRRAVAGAQRTATPAQASPAEAAAQPPVPAVTAVAITVAAAAHGDARPAPDAAAAQSATPTRAKPAHAADLPRIDAPQGPMPSPILAQFNQADASATMNNPVVAASVATPSARDIGAALDHLVAAREALMPAEAALAIDHAEFGEVSIKFEQSQDGRLSAELTAADPELKRVVTAAIAADRGPATGSDGDRSAQLAGQRGSTAAGSDAAAGGRGQSSAQPGAQSGAERDAPQRRGAARSPAQGTTDQGSGVFA